MHFLATVLHEKEMDYLSTESNSSSVGACLLNVGRMPPHNLHAFSKISCAPKASCYIKYWLQSDNGSDWMGLGCTWDTLIPLMTDNSPAPDPLLKMIRCNCTSGCLTLRCSWKKRARMYLSLWTLPKRLMCDNIADNSVSENDENEH